MREKSNHIEQLMKERENVREEMTETNILNQKNILLVTIATIERLLF